MQSLASSPHPSQPANTQTSGQVRRTIGIPANYWGSHQCGVVNRCPWQSGCLASWHQYRTSGSPSFSQTRVTALAHGLCDFLMAPVSSTSWRWAFTSSYMWGVYVSNSPWRASDLLTWSGAWSRMFYPGSDHCGQTGVPIWAGVPWAVLVLLQATPPSPGDSMPPGSILSGGVGGPSQSLHQEDHYDLANNGLGRDFYGVGPNVS